MDVIVVNGKSILMEKLKELTIKERFSLHAKNMVKIEE